MILAVLAPLARFDVCRPAPEVRLIDDRKRSAWGNIGGRGNSHLTEADRGEKNQVKVCVQ